MLARLDPWTNLLRLTSAGFGAAVGGADAMSWAATPTRLASHHLRAAPGPQHQLVLMEESHLGRVADPAGGPGSWNPSPTRLARAAWARFQAIEAAGGVIAALASGQIAAEVAERPRRSPPRLPSGAKALSASPNSRSGGNPGRLRSARPHRLRQALTRVDSQAGHPPARP